MKRIIWTATLFIVMGVFRLSAQDNKWTLEDCINYALENNIGLQRQELLTESAEVNLLKSKMDILPSLNVGSDAQMGFGRSVDPVTNLITFKQNISNSYAVSTSVQVFNGFASMNTISANKFMLKAGVEAEQLARNTLIISIMGQFYQVMYARGLENASKMKLDQSEKQLFRITKMVETGKEAVSKKYEMESQVSADRLAYTIASNDASQALTTFKQLLQLEPSTEFDIVIPDLDAIIITDTKYRSDSIYEVASQVLPRLKAIEYELKAYQKQLAAARGSVSPNLTVGGRVFTGYYKVMSDDAGEQASFSTQLKNNNSQAIYLSLGIPIFNNYTTARNIRLAKIRKNDSELKLQLEKNTLYSEIENACLNCERGKSEYLAAQANLNYNLKSFDAVEKKFESGLIDVTDYSAAKTTLYTAETEALRTKLQLLIRQLTIQFYLTGDYENIVLN